VLQCGSSAGTAAGVSGAGSGQPCYLKWTLTRYGRSTRTPYGVNTWEQKPARPLAAPRVLQLHASNQAGASGKGTFKLNCCLEVKANASTKKLPHIGAERGYCPKSHRQVSGISSHSGASGSAHKPLSANRAVAAQGTAWCNSDGSTTRSTNEGSDTTQGQGARRWARVCAW
jgi:hypothetical protein